MCGTDPDITNKPYRPRIRDSIPLSRKRLGKLLAEYNLATEEEGEDDENDGDDDEDSGCDLSDDSSESPGMPTAVDGFVIDDSPPLVSASDLPHNISHNRAQPKPDKLDGVEDPSFSDTIAIQGRASPDKPPSIQPKKEPTDDRGHWLLCGAAVGLVLAITITTVAIPYFH